MRGWTEAMRHIFVMINENLSEAVAAAAELREWSAAHDVEISETLPAPCDPDLIVALGGDGTLLRAVHAACSLTPPVLSIKFGRLGFLSGAGASRLIEAVSAALDGSARIEEHAVLEGRALSGNDEIARLFAVNELVLRSATAHMLTTRLIINGHVFSEVSGDGLIIATATGSTAYALSVGGPVLSPGFDGLEVVPLAPHTLIRRAVVTAARDRLRIELPDPTRADAALLCDGQNIPTSAPVTAVEVKVAAERLRLVKLEAHNSYEVVARKFFGQSNE